MFSFHGDTVLDPFCGTGTTMLAAMRTGRNSIGVDVDAEYCRLAARRLKGETASLFSGARLVFAKAEQAACGSVELREEPEMYEAPRRGGRKTA